MLRSFFLLLLAVLTLLAGEGFSSGQAIDAYHLFRAGNEHYAQGHFKAATQEYLKIVDANLVNEIVYYNLANAFYKDQQLGQAILYYEKAKKLAPRDREIVENLTLAKAQIVDKVEPPPEGFLWKYLNQILARLSLNQETVLVVVSFASANVLFTLFLLAHSERIRRISISAAGLLFLISLAFGTSNVIRIYQAKVTQEGIVLIEKADVLSGPGDNNATLFSIHEGLKVRVQNELDKWFQMSLENGWNGWIRKEAIGMI